MVVWNLCKNKGLGFGLVSLLSLLTLSSCHSNQSADVDSVDQTRNEQNTAVGSPSDSTSLDNSESGAESRSLLIDYREPQNEPSSLPEDIQERVISQVLEKGTVASCSDSTNPQVLDAASGSFSAPNQSETVYWVSLGDGCQTSGQSTMVAAIFENEELVYTVDSSGYNAIQTVVDLDQDGVDELLIDSLFIHMGDEDQSAAIANLNVPPGEQIQIQAEFPSVRLSHFGGRDNSEFGSELGAELDDIYQKSSVLFYRTNQDDGTVSFEREDYIVPCRIPEVQDSALDLECEPYREQPIALTEETPLDLRGLGPIRVGMTVDEAS
ncbi:MAG: hypothetical protein WBA57_08620, partial [Elainellaceae cyanobacterium]